MNARAAAIHCEAKKHAYRQTQDGVVVSFVIHPQEVPDGLALASLGTRYMLALAEIGDDEKPVKPKAGGESKRSWDDLSYAEQAGIRCGEPAFQKFIGEVHGEGDPAALVRRLCGVGSRRDIRPGTDAGEAWAEIESDYRLWLNDPR